MRGRMGKKKKEKNLMDFIPRRKAESRTGADNTVTLLKPRFSITWLNRLFTRFGKSEYLKVHLDKQGSEVWNQINGSRTVAAIADRMEKEKDETRDQHWRRLAEFMVILKKNGFIELLE